MTPKFGSVLILGGAVLTAAEVQRMTPAALHAYRLEEASTVKLPYLIIALTLIVLAVIIGLFKLPVITAVEDTSASADPHSKTAMKLWKQRHPVLGFVAIVACVLVAISMLTFGHVAMWSIIFVGLFNSVMFPSIFTLGIAGLGPLTGEGSGLLVMPIVGGAIIPEVQGVLADHLGIHHAFILPVLCYLYIAYYGFRGSRPRQAVTAAAEVTP